MPKDENGESKLKIIHVFWTIIIMAVAVGMAWGVVVNQQNVNSKSIEKKLDKELFNLYQNQQVEQFRSLEIIMKDGFAKIDKRLDRIESK